MCGCVSEPRNGGIPGPGRKFPVICIAGPIAAGKNQAASVLERRGWLCVDADRLVHDILEKLKDKIVVLHADAARKRGISLLNADGTLNRRAVGQIVFSDPAALAAQESLVHPAVDAALHTFIDANPDKPIALNGTVFYKTDVFKRCSAVLFVDAPKLIRFFRIKSRDCLGFRQILKRFHVQAGIFAKYKKTNADIYRVWNIGKPYALERKIDKFLAYCRYKGY